MSFPKFRILDGDSKLASEITIKDKLVGIEAQIQQVIGVHPVRISEIRRLYRLNGLLILGDQMLWTEEGWGTISTHQYRLCRTLHLEHIPSLNAFMESVIDWQKLKSLQVGDKLLLSNGYEEEITEIVDVTDQYMETLFSYVITDNNQSSEMDGGYISESFLGIFHPASEVHHVL